VLVAHLIFVGEILPGTASAVAEMSAERCDSLGRVPVALHGIAERVSLLVLRNLDVDDFTRQRTFDEQHLSLRPSNTVPGVLDIEDLDPAV
jgi:hypothetical protein